MLSLAIAISFIAASFFVASVILSTLACIFVMSASVHDVVSACQRAQSSASSGYRDHLNRTQPGIEASASTAARMLLFRALEQVELEMGVAKKKPK